nr:AraC family transcriptional regulator [Pseudodesulfovibrio alkaliphilus]
MAELKSAIEKDFSSVRSVADLCAGIGMSLSKANKAFKALYAISIAQYIQQCKMSYAYSVLVQRQLNVSECTFAVGYSNASHFITAFKKHFGITPKAVSRLRTKGRT